MGILYRNSSGIETPVAGLAPAGQLVPSVSLYQKGSITNTTSIASKDYVRIEITLNTPMPDTDYVVDLQTMQGHGLANAFCDAYGKTNSGFAIILANPSDNNVPANQIQVVWRAFKLMTDEDRALDEAKIEQNTKNFAPNFSATASYAVGDYTTYQGVLYRCTVQHTASAWNSSHFTQVTVGGQLKVQDISSSITTGDGYSSGTISVYRDGNTVQVLFNSVQTTAYDRIICSGLPRPLHNTYFCVQADGNPQGLGLGALSEGGSITSGNSSAGMGPSKVWDGFITYLTRD